MTINRGRPRGVIPLHFVKQSLANSSTLISTIRRRSAQQRNHSMSSWDTPQLAAGSTSYAISNRLTLTAVLLLLAPFTAEAVPADALADAAKVEWQWGVKIPLRDGVRLNATLYKPAGLKEPRPCLFTLTPYIGQSYHDRGMYFAAHGYPFLTVDVRGRGNSEGSFRPLIQEAKDGYDVVEWLAKQPYCNGKISMWGGSYAGYDQWATAKELPPHLATIVPVASPAAGVDFPARNNVFAPYEMQWLSFTSGHTGQDRLFGDDAFWTAMFRRWIESGTSYRKFDGFLGNPSPIFQEWIAHPDLDAYWDSYNPTREQYAKLQLPILTITGMYDDDQPGALAHYSRYMQAASPEARARHFLVIGPWDHPGTRTPKQEFMGMKFGPASLVDLPKLHLDWYRFAMEGGPKPEFLRKPVAYYVSGAEHWRYADTLEAITAESRPMFLDSAGASGREVYAAGSLAVGASAAVRRIPTATTRETCRSLRLRHRAISTPRSIKWCFLPIRRIWSTCPRRSSKIKS
jgi:putative CocE/NonD family hydrolase